MLPRPYLLPIVSLALLFTVAVVLYSWDGSFSHIQRQICSKVSSCETQQTQRTFRPIKLLEKVDEEGTKTTNTFRSSLLPQNGGLLRVRMSDDTEKVGDYGVSMFHQLHCLVVLREIIFPGGSPVHTEHNSSMARVQWAHCFDYLAQAILCAADDTLEPPKTAVNEQGQNIKIIDGVGHIVHQCRDPASLWRVVEEGNARPYDQAIIGHSVRASGLFPGTGYHEMPDLYRAD
ncbi:uncharacterized protein TRUGW13939_10376 [Talaromyces rugulosus]|uniref:Tyrosinase copper-binding domain-containing protein n=1 Tax=Talaromyces rugulosus TaxID=121627 RepID=A0A7H8RAS4_TALRU|nr:uncharacterized protein TRUGW13939_10376 [Talaromyces rugulosus]QKX63207.1 hypothetical protein TRUGW13939_10376 [Talaromyces rugulosus]